MPILTYMYGTKIAMTLKKFQLEQAPLIDWLKPRPLLGYAMATYILMLDGACWPGSLKLDSA